MTRDIQAGIDILYLWLFPEEDFPAYQDLYGPHAYDTYAEYLQLHAEMCLEYRKEGARIEVLRHPVDAMKQMLHNNNWPNDPEHFTKVINTWRTGLGPHQERSTMTMSFGSGKTRQLDGVRKA